MNRMLIVNLGKNDDIFTAAHIINSMKSANHHTAIEMLVYKEYQKAAECLSNVSKVHTIDREEIFAIKNNHLFSNSFALELFFQSLTPLKQIPWSNVFNYSNDPVASYITSYLTSDSSDPPHTGIKFTKNGTVAPSNDWSIVFNEILTSYKHAPMHLMDCYHKMTESPLKIQGDKLISNPVHDKTACLNLNQIRESESVAGQNVKIIGIQLKSSSSDFDIPFEVIRELIDEIYDDPGLFPVLLISSNSEEKVLVNELNKYFDNGLVTIETEFSSSISVIKNLDLLICPNTATKHMADLCNIPLIEISSGNAPVFKHGTYNEFNIILSGPIITNSFGEKGEQSADHSTKVVAKDIMSVIRCQINPKLDSLVNLSNHLSMYRARKDSHGIYYSLVSGFTDPQLEISRHMSRLYLMTLLDIAEKETMHREILRFSFEEVSYWIAKERASLALVTKVLLGTLRTLLPTKKDLEKAPKFISSLDKLLRNSETNHIASIACLLFRGRMESLPMTSVNTNFKNVEYLLYQFKNELQIAINSIRSLEKENQISKNQLQTQNSKLAAMEGIL